MPVVTCSVPILRWLIQVLWHRSCQGLCRSVNVPASRSLQCDMWLLRQPSGGPHLSVPGVCVVAQVHCYRVSQLSPPCGRGCVARCRGEGKPGADEGEGAGEAAPGRVAGGGAAFVRPDHRRGHSKVRIGNGIKEGECLLHFLIQVPRIAGLEVRALADEQQRLWRRRYM